MTVRQRERGNHLHRLAVLDFPKVLLGLPVGDDSESVLANPLGSSLSVVFVEMDPNLVGAKWSIPSPDHVFNRRI